MVCGIDEAGRGPVIGPLVIAGVMIEKEKEAQLKELGVKDSKLLAHKERLRLMEHIKRLADDYTILTVSVDEIDEVVLNSTKMNNLNWLEARKSAEIINELDPEVAILDCPSTNTKAYKEFVENLLTTKTQVIAEHKADVNHPVVSAASILAKCVREEEMDKIRKKYGETGPGYPSNVVTQEFVKKYWNKYPEIFRKSWESYKVVAGKKDQKKLGEF